MESLEDEAANSKITMSFLIKLDHGGEGVTSVLRCLQVEDGSLVHMETRHPRDSTGKTVLEILLTVEIVKDRISHLAGRVRRADHVQASRMVGCKRATVQGKDTPNNNIIKIKQFVTLFQAAGSLGTCLSWTSVTTS